MRTIGDVEEIVDYIKIGYMPEKNLPLDAHIIDYETLYSLMDSIFKKMAYNFILDFLYTFTEFNFDNELQEKLNSTRTELTNNFSIDDLYSCVVGVAPESVKKRLMNKVLEKGLVERLESWKK